MPRPVPSYNTGHSLQDLKTFWRQVPCPKCHAPTGAPCADHRSYDKDLYGPRVHPEREKLIRALLQ